MQRNRFMALLWLNPRPIVQGARGMGREFWEATLRRWVVLMLSLQKFGEQLLICDEMGWTALGIEARDHVWGLLNAELDAEHIRTIRAGNAHLRGRKRRWVPENSISLSEF